MTRNVALMAARRHAGLSQDALARRIQATGQQLGYPNECNRANVARWENGTQPQPFYVLLLEATLNQPAATLGLHDMDRDALLAEAGLDVATPIPEPAARYGYGPLTGIWLSEYSYPSSSRDAVFTSRHYVQILQRGAHLNIRSLPKQHSRLSLDLTVNGEWIKGTWAEHTAEGGYYKGAVYDGTIGMFLDKTERRMKGKWQGYGRDPGEINDGPWQFTFVADKVDRETRDEWDHNPDD
jgi:hypothetical protein